MGFIKVFLPFGFRRSYFLLGSNNCEIILLGVDDRKHIPDGFSTFAMFAILVFQYQTRKSVKHEN